MTTDKRPVSRDDLGAGALLLDALHADLLPDDAGDPTSRAAWRPAADDDGEDDDTDPGGHA